MKVRKVLATGIVTLAMIGTALAAQAPVQDINPAHNPNLAEAQRLIGQAYQKIDVAQRGNHDDMKSHAEKAKQLLSQANVELKMAADAADHH
jgi:hypothetical protein